MGFTLKEIQESLNETRYDEVCATYMLLKRDVSEVSNVQLNNATIELVRKEVRNCGGV